MEFHCIINKHFIFATFDLLNDQITMTEHDVLQRIQLLVKTTVNDNDIADHHLKPNENNNNEEINVNFQQVVHVEPCEKGTYYVSDTLKCVLCHRIACSKCFSKPKSSFYVIKEDDVCEDCYDNISGLVSDDDVFIKLLKMYKKLPGSDQTLTFDKVREELEKEELDYMKSNQ